MPEQIISIEKVLNSRCSSDINGGCKGRHWGIFKDVPPPQDTIKQIIRCCSVPQYSNGKLEIWFADRHAFFGFEEQRETSRTRLLQIESGMQHEAVYLACAALGVGTCIRNQGLDGTRYGKKIATASHVIMEMRDAYKTGKFTTEPPGPEKPFVKGRNLSEPTRDGEMECLPELERLKTFSKSGRSAMEKDVSQLLWATKGRTPHYVGKHPWGLTIPTWGHGQEYTDVYIVKGGKLFQYLNWTGHFPLNKPLKRMLRYVKWVIYRDTQFYITGNPTHDTRLLGNADVLPQLEGANFGIVLSRNEETGRALWEVGYMLENMFLQARSLGVSYKSKILQPSETARFAEVRIPDAVAAFLL